MKIEAKVAIPKGDPYCREMLHQIRAGEVLSHGDLVAAVGDPDGRKVFDPTSAAPLKKENFVLFHYSVFLERNDGTVALFYRPDIEKGQQRITPGPSMLLSHSTPDSPFQAVPRIVAHELCVGRRMRMGASEPFGIAWNHLPPKDDRERPTYVLAVYRHRFPDGLPLHGRYKESPDRLETWVPKAELPDRLSKSGFVDQHVGARIAEQISGLYDEGDDGLVFSPAARIATDAHPADAFRKLEYSRGYHVFVSHAAEDSFAAYALYRFLMDESSRRILARIDLDDLKEGSSTNQISPLLEQCDGVVLLITPNLIAKSRRKAATGEQDWVRTEVETARRLNKPILGFKLGTTERPDYLPDDLICNNRDNYSAWLTEVRRLVDRVQEKFSGGR